jgi:predicted alpha/beta superfamily hydrolase
MTNKLITLILLATAVFSSSSHAFMTGTKSQSFESKVLNQSRLYSVRLPKGYDNNNHIKYPVLYLLDGKQNLGHTSGTLGFLVDSNEMPDMIVVAIDTNNQHRTRDLTPSVDKAKGPSGGAGKLLDFIEKELMPYIDKTYRTKSFRLLAGHSYGGLFTVNALLKRPHLFQAYFAFSPSLQWNNGEIASQVTTFINNNKDLKAYLYMNIGNEGAEPGPGQQMKVEFDKVVALLKQSAPKALLWQGEHYPQETHGTTPVIGQFKAFRQLFHHWMPKYEVATQSIDRLTNHYQQLTTRLGFDILPAEQLVNAAAYDIMSQQKNLAKAKQYFALNIKNYPKSANPYDSMADLLEQQQKIPKALAMVEKAIALSTKDHANYEYLIEHKQRLSSLLK